jgi:hypothetical protein
MTPYKQIGRDVTTLKLFDPLFNAIFLAEMFEIVKSNESAQAKQ